MMRCRIRALGTLLLGLLSLPASAAEPEPEAAALAAFGRTLFHDAALSQDGSVSCATCHDPARAWTDARDNAFGRAVSLGVNASPGLRSAPSLAYAALVPPPGSTVDGQPLGGLFWDGRSATLEDQASGPLFNPREMGLRDAEVLLQRLRANPSHSASIETLFGPEALDDADAATAAVTRAIAAYERSPEFVAFDSRYDRYLRGEYTPTQQEALGMGVFFSSQFSSCSECHQLQTLPQAAREEFSNHGYENIGVPANPLLPVTEPDAGLGADTGALPGEAQRGKFRVPTLRNVAVTAPYMHNGVFAELRSVLLFYNSYLLQGQHAQINPETGEPWAAPEVMENVAHEKLRVGVPMDPRGIDALLAFLQMLTDARFEQESGVAAD
jgi:cytochrome c peroxidase